MNNAINPRIEPPISTLQSVRALALEIARLCALANVPESYVIQTFSEAYSAAPRLPQGLLDDCADPLFASEVLTHWHESEAFLNADGSPRELSPTASEFEDLCAAAGDRSRAKSALSLLLASGALRQRADVVSPARRDLIVGRSLRSSVEFAIRLCAEFAKTLNHNHTTSNDEPRQFERTAMSTKFAPRHVPALLAYLSLHAESFLEDMDNWLKARDSESEGITVGVGVHLFLPN